MDRELAYARHFPSVSWLNSYSEYVDDIAEWWERIDPEWRTLRREALDVLQEEERLREIVNLVGPDVLPDAQRLVLLTAELIRDGFLQQNAFDPVDTYCDPEKQAGLLRVLVTFHRRARRVIESGAPVVRVRELKIAETLARAKSTIKNGDKDGMNALLSDLNKQFDEVEAQYR